MHASGKGNTLYTLDEVARHNTEADCWIVVNDAVIDVTEFLNQHPGGASSISRIDRAGTDVTSAFEAIGHSMNAIALLNKLQIGCISCANREEETEMLLMPNQLKTEMSIGDPLKDKAPLWHANRRKAILRDHPDIAELMGSNPWTCVIGLATVIVHCGTCIYVQGPEVSWWFMFVLAYTVGALCKMFQFAVNHDICHGTAGTWLTSSDLMKRIALQVLTLPCIGGTTHIYYENQHMGHHFALGTLSFRDLFPQQAKDGTLLFENMRKWLFFPDSDGDMLAIGNFAYGRILKKWGGSELDSTNINSNSKPVSNAHTNSNSFLKREYYQHEYLDHFHQMKLYRVLVMQALYIAHHGFLSAAVIFSMLPNIPLISIPAFLFPEKICAWVINFINEHPQYKAMLDNISTNSNNNPGLEKFLIPFIIKSCASQGLHLWIWCGLDIYLLFYVVENWSWSGVIKGILYLYLSELFLFGFLMHPYMGYFLGVHRSGGDGFSRNNTQPGAEHVCQPTMSTYGTLSAICSMNLTHHVEHHDFPSVPWNRLPEITRLAPEYYEDLEQSSSFVYTIYQWFDHSEGWSYGCH